MTLAERIANDDGDMGLAGNGRDFAASVWPGSRGARWLIRIGGTTVASGICPHIDDAKSAAESAARAYAMSILAALPRPEPTEGEVEKVAAALCRSHDDAIFYDAAGCDGAWRAVARAAIAAGLDPKQLKEGT